VGTHDEAGVVPLEPARGELHGQHLLDRFETGAEVVGEGRWCGGRVGSQTLERPPSGDVR
jgi:hypothetical protein